MSGAPGRKSTPGVRVSETTLFLEAIKIYDMEVSRDVKVVHLKKLIAEAKEHSKRDSDFRIEEIRSTTASAGRRHRAKADALGVDSGAGTFS